MGLISKKLYFDCRVKAWESQVEGLGGLGLWGNSCLGVEVLDLQAVGIWAHCGVL